MRYNERNAWALHDFEASLFEIIRNSCHQPSKSAKQAATYVDLPATWR